MCAFCFLLCIRLLFGTVIYICLESESFMFKKYVYTASRNMFFFLVLTFRLLLLLFILISSSFDVIVISILPFWILKDDKHVLLNAIFFYVYVVLTPHYLWYLASTGRETQDVTNLQVVFHDCLATKRALIWFHTNVNCVFFFASKASRTFMKSHAFG